MTAYNEMTDTHSEDLLVEYKEARVDAQREADRLVEQLWTLYQFIRSMDRRIAEEEAKREA